MYALAALIHFRLNLDKLSAPLIVPEAKERQSQEVKESERPKWGVIDRVPLPSDTDGWQKALTALPEDKSRSPWGAINRPKSGEGSRFAALFSVSLLHSLLDHRSRTVVHPTVHTRKRGSGEYEQHHRLISYCVHKCSFQFFFFLVYWFKNIGFKSRA